MAELVKASGSPVGTPPRLMISKMVLENFKSYAGEKTIGPFHKCFSSVVGPNGSGKSNVIDAMLFVFGKRAKKLRLSKVSELIHSSTKYEQGSSTELQFARVTVYFHEIVDTGDGDEDYEVVEGSECVVSRLAKRDDSSTYKLNGKNASFKVVAAYLNEKGIDLDNNRFLILQGEVEMISMMAPKGKNENDEGLLEYLEDIIGSNKYVADADAQMKVVELLTEQRQEKLNRVKVVEKEKEALEGAKVEAEAFMGKEKQLRKKKNVLYQMNAMEVNEETEAVREQHSDMKERLSKEKERLQESEARLTEIEQGYDAQTADYDALHAELKNTKEEFASFERRDIKLREEVKHGKNSAKTLDAKVATETAKIAENSEKAEKAESNIPKLEAKVEKLTSEKLEEDAKLESIYEAMKGVTANLRAELETKTSELAPVQQERAVFQNDLDTAATEVKLLNDTTSRSKEQLQKAEKELASLDGKEGKLKKTFEETQTELFDAKARLPKAEAEKGELEEKEGALKKLHQEFTARAEESKANSQQGTNKSEAVAGLLKASKKGGELAKAGILGRLGDICTVSEKYDVAVSTACGSLDNIVVETTAGAQMCLQFLRKHGLGRASFIPLEKMSKGAHDRVVETPEGAPRLFDLINCLNPDVKPALFHAVNQTLVAPDMETATRWAYDYGKRWRVVTKDGQLIESSGTMAGGGKNVRRGGMKLASASGKSSAGSVSLMDVDTSADDSKEMLAKAAKALEQLKACRNSQKQLTEEIRTLQKLINTLSVKLPKLTMEIESIDTTRDALSKSIPDLRASSTLSKADEKKSEELTKNVQNCKSAMASCAMQASKIEGQVAKLQRSILDAGGPKLKTQQKTCESVLASLNKANTDLNTAKVTLKTCKANEVKAAKAKTSAEEELVEAGKTVTETSAALKVLEDEAFVVMGAFEKAKEAAQEKKEELDVITKEFESLKKTVGKIKTSEVDLVAQLDNYENQLKEGTNRMTYWADEIGKLHSQEELDDEYDMSDDEEEEEVAEEKEKEEGEGEEKNKAMVEGVEKETGTGTEVEKPESETEEKKEGEEAEAEAENDKFKYSKIHSKSLPALQKSAILQFDRSELKYEITTLEKERDQLAKDANMGAIMEYRKKERDYLSRVTELDKVTEERNEARKSWDELRRTRLEKFMDGFGQITLKLKEMYQMITLGGDAELELVDSLDPFSEGIVFSVRPPKKSWKNIANLSGGEKTLSSLALVFALHHFKPTPLYVMDEIDAALDFKNVSIVANYIKERTKNAQFIIISLRNNMFELADRLVGIYKTDNCTKSVTINPKAFGKGSGKEIENGGGSAAAVLGEITNTSVANSA